MADTRQLVVYLALLCGKLDVVGQRLPATAAASAEMAAEGLQPLWTGLDDCDNASLQEAFFLSGDAYVDYVSWNGEFHEEYAAGTFRVVLRQPHVGDGFSLSGDVFDLHVVQYDVQFFISRHRQQIYKKFVLLEGEWAYYIAMLT